MSSIEEQLMRDIADVTGGVVVTESDLMKAREDFEYRMDERRRSDRARALAVAAVAAIVIPLVGVAAYQTLRDEQSAVPAAPGPSPSLDDSFLKGSAPTPEELNGVWRVDNGTGMIRFAPPNGIALDNTNRLFGNPETTGTYTLDGDLITVTIEAGYDGCAGQTFAMRASVPEPGALRMLQTQPAARPECSPSTVTRALEQVLPTSKFLDRLSFSSLTESQWNPLPSRTALYGDWMAEGGGFLLEITPGGAYYVAGNSGALVDHGEWSTSGPELTLTSSGRWGDCGEGDRLVMRGVELVVLPPSVMRGTVDQNSCGGEWTPAAWVLIP